MSKNLGLKCMWVTCSFMISNEHLKHSTLQFPTLKSGHICHKRILGMLIWKHQLLSFNSQNPYNPLVLQPTEVLHKATSKLDKIFTLISDTILVHWCCYIKISQTREFVNNRSVFITVVGLWTLGSRHWQIWYLVTLSCCVLTWWKTERQKELGFSLTCLLPWEDS
jgi:hypothetical protein